MKKTIMVVGVVVLLCITIFVFQKIDSDLIVNLTDNTDIKPESGIQSSKVIDLSNDGLKKVPEYVFDKTEIEELNISNNFLGGSIQAEIRFLTKLKVLNASNNLMTGLPAEIGQLADLEILNLSNNQLTGLPNELGNLKNLKILNLSGNKYSEQDLEVIRNSLPQTVNIIVD